MQDAFNFSGGNLSLEQMAYQMLNRIPLGFVVFDNELSIRDQNISARNILMTAGNIAHALQQGCSVDHEIDWADQLTEAIHAREPSVFENFTYSNNGRAITLHVICSPIYDHPDRTPIGGILLLEDISAIHAIQQELASAERLAAVGKLAARVAHELNNPLDGILRYINLALRMVENSDLQQPAQYLAESRKGLMRMVQIVGELLEFSRSSFSSVEEADINKIIEDAVKAMESHALRHQVHINRHYSPAMPNVRSGNLVQVFTNLIKNGIDAMPGGGSLDILTQCDEHYATIAISDSGPGISEEIKDKLFEPFFTTKDQGKGTGLGLSICKDIVERYHGQIQVRNRESGGCTFSIRIPREYTLNPSVST